MGTHVEPSGADTLVESPCVSCGVCVDSCPTGALEDRSIVQLGLPTRWTRTTCPYCGVGCELQVGTRDERIVTCVPALDAPVNRGHLCVRSLTRTVRARVRLCDDTDGARRRRLAGRDLG